MYAFDQFLSSRSAYGATVDAGGDRLYFISDTTGAPQLWSVPADDDHAWPEPIAVGLDRVNYAIPSPLPGRLVLGADVDGNERTQLYLLETLGRPPRPLTAIPTAIHAFGGWHPDGRTIAFSSNERDPRFFDVYTLDLQSGARRMLMQDEATLYAKLFSPDGRSLLVQQVDSPSDQTVYVVDVDSGAARRLSEPDRPSRYVQLAWSADGRWIYCTTDRDREFMMIARLDATNGALEPVVEASWDIGDLALSPDGRRLLYEVNVDGISEVRIRDLESGVDAALDVPPGLAGGWQPTFWWFPDAERFAFPVTTPTASADVYVGRVGDATVKQVTRTWKAGLCPDVLVPAELMHYPSFDGRRIPAFVFRRPVDGMAGPRAAVFFVHGGPESQLRPAFNPVIQYLAHRGFVVVAPNVRGSSGYGKTYLHLDDVDCRMDAVADLAAGAEWVARSGLADPDRIAVMGASYGGFMVLAALATYPALWAAGVDIVGVANFVTFMEHTGPWRRRQREAEYGSLEHHRDVLERISPIHQADKIVAPLFVIHGANDPRVPVGEAEQIVASLRRRGRPVEYLRFEDEGHGLVKLKNRLAAYPSIADFLEEHLGVG